MLVVRMEGYWWLAENHHGTHCKSGLCQNRRTQQQSSSSGTYTQESPSHVLGTSGLGKHHCSRRKLIQRDQSHLFQVPHHNGPLHHNMPKIKQLEISYRGKIIRIVLAVSLHPKVENTINFLEVSTFNLLPILAPLPFSITDDWHVFINFLLVVEIFTYRRLMKKSLNPSTGKKLDRKLRMNTYLIALETDVVCVSLNGIWCRIWTSSIESFILKSH